MSLKITFETFRAILCISVGNMGEENTNRKVKDSVFVDLFGKDETAPQNFLSLYNALHDTNLSLKDTTLKPEMLDSAMYMTFVNDVAMQINGKIVVLIEHQSTINKNMPLRLLDYIIRIYERIIPSKSKFKRSLIKIPLPEFYVLYNGTEKTESFFEERLSDAFYREEGDTAKPSLELLVKVYNINTDIGKDLLKKCSVLKQYSQLIDLIRYSKSHAEELNTEEPFKWAIQEAKKKGVLNDYLERKAAEVINMFSVEYDYTTDIATQREEAWEQGLERGKIETAQELFQMGLTIEQIAQATHLPLSEINKIRDNL